MPEYRRWIEAGATFYFVVVTHGRRAVFDHPSAVGLLRQAFAHVRERHPFTIQAPLFDRLCLQRGRRWRAIRLAAAPTRVAGE